MIKILKAYLKLIMSLMTGVSAAKIRTIRSGPFLTLSGFGKPLKLNLVVAARSMNLVVYNVESNTPFK